MFKECIPDPRNTEKTISKCTGWCTPLDYPVEGSKGTVTVHEWHKKCIHSHIYYRLHTSVLQTPHYILILNFM